MNNIVQIVEDALVKEAKERNQKMFQFEKNKLYAYLEDLKDSLIKHKAFIAGGTITSLLTGNEINDLDIYFRNEESLIAFLKDHWQDGETYVTTLTKKSVLLVKGKAPDYRNVQLIHFKYFNNAQEIFDTFDFTVCMGAFDFTTEQFILHQDFLKHNSQRLLKFNKGTAFPLVSLLRVQKYSKKGYHISKPEFIRIALKCMDLDVDSVDKLKDHLGGMYGINYDKIINLGEGEDFSLDLVIDKISNIALREDYFKKPVEIKFDNLEDIIDSVKKRPIHIISLGNQYYRIYSSNKMKHLNAKAPFFIELNSKEYFESKRFYKWVHKESEGKYQSHYQGSFKYEDGQTATALGDHLYFNEKEDIDSSFYSQKGELIEVKVNHEDFVGLNGTSVHAKACTVIREVPKTEWEHWLEEDLSDDAPF
ncbi:hypothetical protein NV379_01775 [Paenibacillus sp. N1-5-1-14]|uniref:hypothetical protein n=1 Tax=Paenibacillus radicibacter TaxID=2972488 RepID=UPI002158D941|nr:hypothetical protein [Paenibacillus radicibacter]MCR8641374.1 hypothetical protein [Paenibacillus radicibacter]